MDAQVHVPLQLRKSSMMVISEVIWQKMSMRWLVALNLGNIRSRTSNFPEARYNSGLKWEENNY